MTPSKSKNFKLATEFYDFCCAHPDLRFWQALRTWSAQSFILAASESPIDIVPKIDHDQRPKRLVDTFFWENKSN